MSAAGKTTGRTSFSSFLKSDVNQPNTPPFFAGLLSSSRSSVISYANVNARLTSAGLAGMGPSKWQGMTLLKSQLLQMLSTQRLVVAGTFENTRVSTTGPTIRRLATAAKDASGSNRLDGPKYSTSSAILFHPRILLSKVSGAGCGFAICLTSSGVRSPAMDRFSKPSRAISSSAYFGMTSGTFSVTRNKASVTISVLVRLWKKAISVSLMNLPALLMGGGAKSFCSISSAQGASGSSLFNSPSGKMPKNCSGRLRGKDHWYGVT
mmetsp:Transcript_11526/g.31414  ORF Transcript_11526/g.31414 Transcript_11526/m.31414 type:complete len:265 (-) Transcript_11526:764-1558(-)